MMTGVVSEHRERGNRYDTASDYVLPDLTDLVLDGGRAERATVRLDSVYFDTERHDLLAHGVTLRCRTGQADTGWQLEVPAGEARSEIRVHPTGSHTTVPKELAVLLAGVRRGTALRHVVTVRTDRSTLRVLDADDRLVVEVADDTVDAVAPGRRAATVSRWREIEAELGPAGGEELLAVIDARLTRSGARPSASPNKVARALGVPTDDVAVHWPGRTAGDLIGAYLAEQDDALIGGDLTLRRGLGGIHPTRVATRRLPSTLRVFAGCFDPGRAQAFDAELAWYTGLLGEVRDREVQRARFAAAIAELPGELVFGPVAARAEQQLLTEQVQRQKTLDSAMNSKRYFALLQESRRWASDPPFTATATERPATLRAAVRAAGKKMTKHLAAGPGTRWRRCGAAQGPQGRQTSPLRRRTGPPGPGKEENEQQHPPLPGTPGHPG